VFLAHARELSLKRVTTVYGDTLLRAGIAVIARQSRGNPEIPIIPGAGEFDGAITMHRQAFGSLEETMPGLRKKVLLLGAGHWIQQERPTEVNDLLVQFLKSL